ncbi:FG-GAP-like repeat-containing protein [Desulfococcaceae bacterium HSG7]|nr:FG-GAP-like repeat-containing protein [Desulfococcaceae bacterium HSG7]
MNRGKAFGILSLVIIMGTIWALPATAKQSHPFLIVSESEYPVLRQLADSEPWLSMKQVAQNYCLTRNYPDQEPNLSGEEQIKAFPIELARESFKMREIVTTCALAYLLEENDSSRLQYRTKLVNTLLYWGDLYEDARAIHEAKIVLEGILNAAPFFYPGGAFFESVLALDIIYDDIDPSIRQTIEQQMKQMADWWYSFPTKEMFGIWGPIVPGIWALYKGDRAMIDLMKSKYKELVLGRISDGGVFYAGPGYAVADLGGGSESVWTESTSTEPVEPWADGRGDGIFAIMDVFEYTGEDNYYSEPRLQAFYEWMYGYGFTPFGFLYGFGDTAPEPHIDVNYPADHFLYVRRSAGYHAAKFSEKAGNYAAWWQQRPGIGPCDQKLPSPSLLNYLLFPRNGCPTPEKATSSRIFWDAGAWFIEKSTSTEALGGVLWSYKQGEQVDTIHMHKEANAIALVGYGQPLLRNGGYADWGVGVGESSWEYINTKAESGNTVMIDEKDHHLYYGKGITEGITTDLFDYASSSSGSALSNGHHQRNFLFLHPEDDVNGYWIVFDEVTSQTSGFHKVNLVFHPNSDYEPTVTNHTEYQWIINNPNNTVLPSHQNTNHAGLSIFLGSPQNSDEIKSGGLANGGQGRDFSFTGRYLYATYDTSSDGTKGVVTVFFPYDDTHSKAPMTRLSGSGYTGAKISHAGGVTDYAVETTGSNISLSYDNFPVSASGKNLFYRQQNGALHSYFVREGPAFQASQFGFTSDANITLYMKENKGQLVSPETNVTLYAPNITQILINGNPATLITQDALKAQVFVPQGTHSIQVIIGGGTNTGVKIFLEGAYSPTEHQMTTALRTTAFLGDLLPMTAPYCDNPRTVGSIATDVTDWVLVELRQSPTSTPVISRSVLLRNDGMLVADDGTPEQFRWGMASGNYYIVIKHRNHLAVMSNQPVAFSNGVTGFYDFTQGSLQFYGTNGAIELETGVWGMVGGNGNGDCQIDSIDVGELWTRTQGVEGYLTTDYSLVGMVEGNGYLLSENNSGAQCGGFSSGDVCQTSEQDTTSPVISNISVTNIGTSTATIRWTTDEPANTSVEYSATPTYDAPLNVSDISMVTEHSITLSGLQPNTTYYYRITSYDAAGNVATETGLSFTTLASSVPLCLGITNLWTDSGRDYTTATAAIGNVIYSDRSFTITTIPAQYAGICQIITANEDKQVNSPLNFLTFDASNPVTVYVGYNIRKLSPIPPAWLTDWTDTGDTVTSSDETGKNLYQVYAQNFPAGTVELGPNMAATNSSSMYLVFLRSVFNVAHEYGVADNRQASAAAWFDYDNDGDLDLLVTSDRDAYTLLYRNDGQIFVDVAQELGINVGHTTTIRRLSVGDYDNDGDVDIAMYTSSGHSLFQNDFNDTGVFTKLETSFRGSATFTDYDNDGDLDMYFPMFGTPNGLLRNEGGGVLIEIPGALGSDDAGHARTATWADYDGDGDMDVYVVNGRGQPSALYRNDIAANGTFTNVTAAMGVGNEGSQYGDGACWGDYDNDGDPDLYVIDYGKNRFYRNDINTAGHFTEVGDILGVSPTETSTDASWVDYDNDGDLDLYVVTTQNIPNRLYRNEIAEGNGFVETGEMAAMEHGWGGSWADFDQDGDMDYYLTLHGANKLYQNASSQNGNHWLHLKLIGTVSNRSAIGATIQVIAGELVQTRYVESRSGFGSQNSLMAEFGLGTHTMADTVTIKWPSGIEQVLTDKAANQLLMITEPNTGPVWQPGDINGDGNVDLQDAIIVLHVLSGYDDAGLIRPGYVASGADVNGDGRIGMEELLYILQKEAELR